MFFNPFIAKSTIEVDFEVSARLKRPWSGNLWQQPRPLYGFSYFANVPMFNVKVAPPAALFPYVAPMKAGVTKQAVNPNGKTGA